MEIPSAFFNPFEGMIFDRHFCFLSGDLTTDNITVFPDWLMDHFDLRRETLRLMENSKVREIPYEDLKLPCSAAVKAAFDELDHTVYQAYKKGYEGIAELEEKTLFQWSGRIVYGLFYLEMVGEWEVRQKQGKGFHISPNVAHRLRLFHAMLQSLIKPVTFGDRKPWSLVVFPLKYSADLLSYRDDVINLMFQFGVNGFGFVFCFQDNGIVAEKQQDILEKIKGYTLHPVQFEELYGRLHYTMDLLQYKPQYHFTANNDGIRIDSLPITQDMPEKPIFGNWIDDFYARLLSNYWQVYGIEKGDILKFQQPFLSYLERPHTKDFITPESIDLPF